ncbi:MAG TPA: HAMP domain-containing sensor histidine kinase [Candidatus Limnocylindria bacterium]
MRRGRDLRQAAHDIRTPLATVVQGVDALLDLGDADSPRARDIFELLRRNVLWMGELLETSTMKTSRGQQEFDAVELIRETVSLMRPVLDARAQTVRVSGAASLALRADHQRLARALLNLLENASKYGPRGDQLVVSARRRKAGKVIAVHDHGPGIPSGERRAIFRAFYRTAEAKASQSGYGLGLALVNEVAAAHGGTVGVSCVGGTTRVWIYLPDRPSIGSTS